ncbi:MAG: glycine cleavage system protein GcvH [Desulfurococcales archaeon]|nr:glycine cleavage system protein GcvH [Desulfurococcales archaeon]
MGRVKVDIAGKIYEIDDSLLYTETDEWVRVEDDKVRVGITDYAQKELKDIVGVELPEPGCNVKKGDAVAVLESVKATADVYSPVDGVVDEVNERLLEEPELINRDPYGEGWIFTLKPSDRSQLDSLLSPTQYIEKLRRSKGGH